MLIMPISPKAIPTVLWLKNDKKIDDQTLLLYPKSEYETMHFEMANTYVAGVELAK
jgi:hypothetical protein